MGEKHITITDVAEALGVSKTTVSRAISGKGRIGEETKQKVLSYIAENDYKPNVIAKSLAQSKTYNICVVMPGDYALVDLPFFQEAIMGIQEIATIKEYDILLSICQQDDITGLERVVSNRKVDGVILLRTFDEDPQIEFLMDKNIPFVATGSTACKGVKQIDHDHESACRELTSIVLMKKGTRAALLGGNEKIMVNKRRLKGFKDGCKMAGREVDEELIFLNLESRISINHAVEEALSLKADCILCMDDGICSHVLKKLRQDHIKVPSDVKVASFYNSSVLQNNVPSITSLAFDAKELGVVACKNLLSQIEGEEVPSKMLLSYEVVLKESTK